MWGDASGQTANFKQQDGCKECFGQFLALLQKWPISSKSTVAQSVFTPISSNGTVAHRVLDKVQLVNKSRHFQENRQLRRVFLRQFRATVKLRTLLLQVLSKEANRISWILLTTHINFCKFTVASPLSRRALGQTANSKQQHCCARRFGQILALSQRPPISRKTLVAQSDQMLISSSTTVAHGVLDKFYVFNKCSQLQGKGQLRRVF